jgi:hypothetical protein
MWKVLGYNTRFPLSDNEWSAFLQGYDQAVSRGMSTTRAVKILQDLGRYPHMLPPKDCPAVWSGLKEIKLQQPSGGHIKFLSYIAHRLQAGYEIE